MFNSLRGRSFKQLYIWLISKDDSLNKNKKEISDHALRLRDACVSDNITIAVPTILIYEVLNFLTHVKPTQRN